MENTATHNGNGKKATSEINTTVEALKEKSQSLRGDLSEIKNLLSELFTEGADYAKEGGAEKLHLLQKKGMKKLSEIEHSMERHPIESILIGAGLGLVFGAYMFRK